MGDTKDKQYQGIDHVGPNEKALGGIVAFLGLQKAPVSEAQILKAVRGRRQGKVLALRALVAEGKVHRSGAGKKADPFLYGVEPLRNPSLWDDENDGEEILI